MIVQHHIFKVYPINLFILWFLPSLFSLNSVFKFTYLPICIIILRYVKWEISFSDLDPDTKQQFRMWPKILVLFGFASNLTSRREKSALHPLKKKKNNPNSKSALLCRSRYRPSPAGATSWRTSSSVVGWTGSCSSWRGRFSDRTVNRRIRVLYCISQTPLDFLDNFAVFCLFYY